MGLRKPKRLQQSKGYHRSSLQESELAARVDGEVVPGSGSGVVKGDVRRKGYVRLESKTTQARSFRVTRDMVDKIERAALNSGEVPGIEVEFIDDKGRRQCAVAVVPVYVLEMLGVIRDEKTKG